MNKNNSILGVVSYYIGTIIVIVLILQNYNQRKDPVLLVLQSLVVLILLIYSIVATVKYIKHKQIDK